MATPTIALQLYSIRTQLAENRDRALEQVAAAGYRTVEAFGIGGDAGPLRASLDAHGLTARTAHAKVLGADQDAVFAAAAALGASTVLDPFTDPERWTSAEGVERIADELSEAYERAQTFGLDFGYHNHAFELSNRVGEQSALEYLADRLPAGMALEVDTYWAAIGGVDVPQLLRTLGERVRMLHLKDAPRLDDGTLSAELLDQLPVGEGALPWAEIIAAAPHAQLLVAEFDEFDGDVFDGAARSLQALTSLGGHA